MQPVVFPSGLEWVRHGKNHRGMSTLTLLVVKLGDMRYLGCILAESIWGMFVYVLLV